MFKGDRLNEENDSKYRSYAQQLDKALKAFEGTSRWPDLIYAISRLIKVLENNAKFASIPSRLLIGQRLAQCLHPELPSSVQNKALEAYDLIFKIIGPERLVEELSIYSNGLFPLLSQADIRVKPELLKLYENHFGLLGKKLKPALDGFLIAVLPGLEENSEGADKTDELLIKVCNGVGRTYFYGTLWRCVLIDSTIRLPAITFILNRFKEKKELLELVSIMATLNGTFICGLCASLLDQNVLVQRAALDLLWQGFPMNNGQLSESHKVRLTTAALTVLLRRDVSLNRRLNAWLFDPPKVQRITKRKREEYFSCYSQDIVSKALVCCLAGPKDLSPSVWSSLGSKWSYSLIICLLGNEDISKPILGNLCIDILRSIYKDTTKVKVENDMMRTCNLLLTSLKMDYLWQRLYDLFTKASSHSTQQKSNQITRIDNTATINEQDESQLCSSLDQFVQPVGSENETILEIMSLMDYLVDVNAYEAESAPRCFQKALFFVLDHLIKFCECLTPAELVLGINLCCKITSKVQPNIVLERAKTPCKDVDGLSDIKEETESLCHSETATLKMDDASSLCVGEDKMSVNNLSINDGPLQSFVDHKTYTDQLVNKVTSLFSNIVDKCFVTNCELLEQCFDHFVTTATHLNLATSPKRSTSLNTFPPSSTIQVHTMMIPVFIDLCALIVKTALMTNLNEDDDSILSPPPPPSTTPQPSCQLPFSSSPSPIHLSQSLVEDIECLTIGKWLKKLLSLSFFTDRSLVRVRYCSIDTVLVLISILKSQLYDLPLPANLANFTQSSSSPVLDFNTTTNIKSSDSTSISPAPRQLYPSLLIDNLLSYGQLQFIYSHTDYFIKITSELWDDLRDEFNYMHLKTADMLQRVHNLARDSSVCEGVICSAMASSDEFISYEARKRFCTLFAITRDLRQKSLLFANMREFDRPLFFMLDSLAHKLDPHNSQALDWLNQCLKCGDIARILEPLMFILLHPDTNRISVQHVNMQQQQQQQQQNCDDVSTKTGSMNTTDNVDRANDGSDIASITASESKICAISNTGGNLTYHQYPEGKKRVHLSSANNKVLALTTQNNQSSGKSGTNRWVTSKIHFPEYQAPPMSCDANSGRHLSINMFLNPFGSLNSLTSDIMDVENNPLSLISTQTSAETPTPHQNSSDSDIIANLLDELIENVVSHVDDDDDNESRSSSSCTTTCQTKSESIPFTNWIKPVSVNHLHSHMLLYTQVYDSRRTLYALNTLWNIILADPQTVLFKMATTNISNRIGSRSTELQTLCARHAKSILGRSFYGDVDSESLNNFKSSHFLEVIVTTCLYYLRSFYPSLPHSRLGEDEIQGNQKVRLLSCEILRLIFSELVIAIKRKPSLSAKLNDMLMSCKAQKVILHEVVSSVYNFQQSHTKNGNNSTNNKSPSLNNINNNNIDNNNHINGNLAKDKTDSRQQQQSLEDTFPDNLVDFNEKCGWGFQEDMQKCILKLLEELMILEHKVSPAASQNEKDMPTHNRKETDSRAARIRFQPQISALKYCPNILIPSQSMFSSAIQTALQQTHKANLHANWLSLVEATLPYAGRSLTRLIVCVISQLCHNIEKTANNIENYGKQSDAETCDSVTPCDIPDMPPNYLTTLLKSLSSLSHYCLLDTPNSSSNTLLNTSPIQSSINSSSSSSSTGPLQVLSNILNAFSNIDGVSELNAYRDNQSANSSDPLVSSRRTVLSHLHRILTAILSLWKVVSVSNDGQSLSTNFPSSTVHHHQKQQAASSFPSKTCSISLPSPTSFTYSSSVNSNLIQSDDLEISGWQIMGTPRDIKRDIIALLSPISIVHSNNFLTAVATVWYELRDSKNLSNDQRSRSVIPLCSEKQALLVNLVSAIRVLPMESVLQTVRHVIKQPPHAVRARKEGIPIEVSILQFLLAYIKVFPGSQLLECWKSLHTLLRDGLQIASNSPLAQFHLLAILHEFIQAAPLFEDRKDQKDLQEVAQKLIEACTTVAAARLSQTKWLRKNLEVRPGPQHDSIEEDDDQDFRDSSPFRMESLQTTGIASSLSSSIDPSNPDGDLVLARYSVQALNALAQFVAPVLDVVYVSEEKEKVVPLVSNIIGYVTPYLKNHSKNNVPSFRACSHLLSSISGYQYSRKAWRKDALELFMDSSFFQMEPSCLSDWKIIIDHLMTHDKTSFRDFLSLMSVNKSGSLKIFSSKDQEIESRAQLTKRLAFILYCSEKDQYQKYMPEIQEKLIDALRVNIPTLQANILLCFRVLITRMSSHCLRSLWPLIHSEMYQVFLQIELDLLSDGTELRKNPSSSGLFRLSGGENSWSSNGLHSGVGTSPGNLHLFLQACKLLDLALSLPTESIPLFQMNRWIYVSNDLLDADASKSNCVSNANYDSIEDYSYHHPSPSPTPSYEPSIAIAVKIERLMKLKNPKIESQSIKSPKSILDLTTISSVLDLYPFFNALVKSPDAKKSLLSKYGENQPKSHTSEAISHPATAVDMVLISEEQSNAIDRIFEMDFLEQIPSI